MDFIKHATETSMRIAEAKDTEIRRQLSWLVSRDLLVIHEREGKYLQLEDGQFIYRQEIELKVKDAEYIEELEKKVAELTKFKQQIEALTNKD
jgi:hypothetical protein